MKKIDENNKLGISWRPVLVKFVVPGCWAAKYLSQTCRSQLWSPSPVVVLPPSSNWHDWRWNILKEFFYLLSLCYLLLVDVQKLKFIFFLHIKRNVHYYLHKLKSIQLASKYRLYRINSLYIFILVCYKQVAEERANQQELDFERRQVQEQRKHYECRFK